MSNAHACNHMSTITIVVFRYHCHQSCHSNNEDNNIATIAQPYYSVCSDSMEKIAAVYFDLISKFSISDRNMNNYNFINYLFISIIIIIHVHVDTCSSCY